MRTIILPQPLRSDAPIQLTSGPGGPLFEPGPQTRIFRAPVRAIAVATCGEAEAWGQVLDISLGGCLFKTDDPMHVGDLVSMRITIIGDDRRAVAEVQGRVCRETEDGGRPAYGIELTAADSDDRRVLQWLYAQALR